MAGYIADLLDEVPTQGADDLPVESGVLNLFVVTLREGLAKLNNALLDKFREVDDKIDQIRGMIPEIPEATSQRRSSKSRKAKKSSPGTMQNSQQKLWI